MREVKLKINKRTDIKKIITDKFKEMHLSEYYMRVFNSETATTYFFVYELIYTTYKQVSFFMRCPGKIVVSTSIVAKVTDNSTEVSLVLSTDDNDNIPNSMIVYLKDQGFKIEK